MLYVFLIIVIIFLIWLFYYFKNKKAKYVLPYLILIFITPFYELLDKLLFLKVFGCGCVPETKKNMLGIGFNANDLRITFYFLLSIFIFWYSFKLSKDFKRKDEEIVYGVSTLIINLFVIYFINKIFIWM